MSRAFFDARLAPPREGGDGAIAKVQFTGTAEVADCGQGDELAHVNRLLRGEPQGEVTASGLSCENDAAAVEARESVKGISPPRGLIEGAWVAGAVLACAGR